MSDAKTNPQPKLTREICFAEAVGTFALVFAGCGAIVVDAAGGGSISHVGICLVFGLVVMAMIYAVGNISGAHFNPAVTIGFYAADRLPASFVAPYIACQLAGALIAAFALRWLLGGQGNVGATLPSTPLLNAFVLEVVITFLLMFVILNVSTGHMEKGIMAGVAVGGTVALCALFAGPVTGASMNPARSIGPAIAAGQLKSLWLYIAAPVTGALLAAPTCRMTQGEDCCNQAMGNET